MEGAALNLRIISSRSPHGVEHITSFNSKYVLWSPLNGADRYNVYLLENNRLVLLDDVSDPEYSMDGELWTMYPFRIAAIDESGNDGPLSDPVGIVAVP